MVRASFLRVTSICPTRRCHIFCKIHLLHETCALYLRQSHPHITTLKLIWHIRTPRYMLVTMIVFSAITVPKCYLSRGVAWRRKLETRRRGLVYRRQLLLHAANLGWHKWDGWEPLRLFHPYIDIITGNICAHCAASVTDIKFGCHNISFVHLKLYALKISLFLCEAHPISIEYPNQD